MRELILKLNREHQITVLISSHILDELSRLATHYGFIDKGQMVKEISAQDLENACRKCVRIEVSDIKALSTTLDNMKVEYNIISDNVADVSQSSAFPSWLTKWKKLIARLFPCRSVMKVLKVIMSIWWEVQHMNKLLSANFSRMKKIKYSG